ncbi:MAG: Hsp20 family protein [Verrucomicrobia bacterium]|nr:Hsp20 family protein [Verrucomicrobiota bacterium]MBU6446225.1 Hsp20 family protein [Verrucomicrobiota bacterium]MDE3048186.1 Hsp20 family protein [Verrucomicrobiota bacterium]
MSLVELIQEMGCYTSPQNTRFSETQEAYIIEALVAGVNKKDIEITFEKGALSITAKSERYQYSYLIPLEGVQIDESVELSAVAEEGILKIVLPKAKIKSLKIPVK